jgi:hypothetical protein
MKFLLKCEGITICPFELILVIAISIVSQCKIYLTNYLNIVFLY